MVKESKSIVLEMLKNKERQILDAWLKAIKVNIDLQNYSITDDVIKQESIQFLREFVRATSKGNMEDISSEEYSKLIEILRDLSRSRAISGFSPSETATYIFSLKDILIEFIRIEFSSDLQILSEETIRMSKLLDNLGLVTFEEYSRGRDEILKEQKLSIMELSSPIVTLWDNVIAIPIIGILDSKRTQLIMENLLEMIVEKEIKVCIIDITGVSVMDTLVSSHLVKTSEAIKLLGAMAIITGIRPEVAQTIVHLGVDLSSLETRATMADGLKFAFSQLGLQVEGKKR